MATHLSSCGVSDLHPCSRFRGDVQPLQGGVGVARQGQSRQRSLKHIGHCIQQKFRPHKRDAGVAIDDFRERVRLGHWKWKVLCPIGFAILNQGPVGSRCAVARCETPIHFQHFGHHHPPGQPQRVPSDSLRCNPLRPMHFQPLHCENRGQAVGMRLAGKKRKRNQRQSFGKRDGNVAIENPPKIHSTIRKVKHAVAGGGGGCVHLSEGRFRKKRRIGRAVNGHNIDGSVLQRRLSTPIPALRLGGGRAIGQGVSLVQFWRRQLAIQDCRQHARSGQKKEGMFEVQATKVNDLPPKKCKL